MPSHTEPIYGKGIPSSSQHHPMRRYVLLTLLLSVMIPLAAQQVTLNKQRHFKKYVPAGNYSGITWLGGHRFAVANDKSPTAGFHLMSIHLNPTTGAIQEVRADSFMTHHLPNRDEEDICFVPHTHTVFVCGEQDQQIVEYDMSGKPTGRKLSVPEVFLSSHGNGGLESLTYNAITHLFWTTTENTLKTDGALPTIQRKTSNRLRLQSFGDDLMPRHQYWYQTDSSVVKGTKGVSTLGVSGLAALDDGRIIVLEREIWRSPRKIGSFVNVKLYIVDPSSQQPGDILHKQLLTEFRTKINLTKRSFANYEGICVGPKLNDGRQTILLVADSQNRYKGILKDWFKTLVIP